MPLKVIGDDQGHYYTRMVLDRNVVVENYMMEKKLAHAAE